MADPRLINADLAPTTDAQRTWSRWHIAALWIGMAVCIPTYTLASGMVDAGWSWKVAVLAVALGNLVVLGPMLLNAHAGTRYGIPFPVMLRSSFGVFGSNIPALMRGFVACGWFGIQTWIGGSALYQLTLALFPGAPTIPLILPQWVGIGAGELLSFSAFWLLNVAIIWRGMESIRILETWGAPLLLAMGVALFGWAWVNVGSLEVLLQEHTEVTRDGWSALTGAGITGGVAFWGTLALNIPDFARYAKNQREQVIGQALGLVPTMTAFAFIGAIVTNATMLVIGTRVSDPVALVAQVGGPWVTVLAMLALVIATLTTNLAANVVSPANDFSNLSPSRISFRRGALIATVIGVLIMPWKLYNDAAQYLFTWLIGYGALLGAVAGIMISDYFVLRRCKLIVEDLYRRGGAYEYTRGFNPIALVALALGIAPNVPGFLAALGVMETSPLFQGLYDRAWFVSFGIASGVYLFGMWLKKTVAKPREASVSREPQVST